MYYRRKGIKLNVKSVINDCITIQDNTVVPPKQNLIKGGIYGGKPMRLLGMNHDNYQQETKFEVMRLFEAIKTNSDVK